jgi:hypothetical protein
MTDDDTTPASPHRPGPGSGPEDRAVTDVVGNILMIGVTVTLASALAYSLSTIATPDNPVSADLVVQDNADLNVSHRGGESIHVDGPTFIVETGGTEERHPLEDFSDDVSGGSSSLWEIGEEVCLSCNIGGTIDAVNFVAGNEVILEWERT